jgi:hypothetical protein
MATIAGILLGLVIAEALFASITVPISALRAFVALKLYGWFVVTSFATPEVSFLHVWGMMQLVALLTVKFKDLEAAVNGAEEGEKKKVPLKKAMTSLGKLLLANVGFSLITLLCGYVIHRLAG